MFEDFAGSLKYPTSEKPLVILLDSLDQLDPGNGARQLNWIPRELPGYVRLIVSTLPEEQYECFPKLQVHMPDAFIDCLYKSGLHHSNAVARLFGSVTNRHFFNRLIR